MPVFNTKYMNKIRESQIVLGNVVHFNTTENKKVSPILSEAPHVKYIYSFFIHSQFPKIRIESCHLR